VWVVLWNLERPAHWFISPGIATRQRLLFKDNVFLINYDICLDFIPRLHLSKSSFTFSAQQRFPDNVSDMDYIQNSGIET